jgi:hypothetical protein
MSCIPDAQNGSHDTIRRTWAAHMVPGLDYKIFMGQGTRDLAPDEVQLDAPDGPWTQGLCEKSQAMKKWALEHGYDGMLKLDSDTYVSPKRFMSSGFEKYDYIGYFPYIPDGTGPGFRHHQTPEGPVPPAADGRGKYIYASGGAGYYLSKRALEAMVAAPQDNLRLDNNGIPSEDLWIPNVLFPMGMRGYHNPRYLFMGNHLVGDAITVHLGCGRSGYNPSWMDKCHELSKDAL